MNLKSGTLTLIPTPLADELPLDSVAIKLLNEAALNKAESSLFVIEDLKPGRKRWLSFGLPRDNVDSFVLYNEHTKDETSKFLLGELKNGKDVYLMSDGGLPSFCDPGRELVYWAHKNKIKVTSTPFHNSVILALALSGLKHDKFWFEGFMPLDKDERRNVLKKILNSKHTTILMDTPYRLKRLLEELVELKSEWKKKEFFLAMDLNNSTEELLLLSPELILSKISDLKREFILIISE